MLLMFQYHSPRGLIVHRQIQDVVVWIPLTGHFVHVLGMCASISRSDTVDGIRVRIQHGDEVYLCNAALKTGVEGGARGRRTREGIDGRLNALIMATGTGAKEEVPVLGVVMGVV